MGTRKNQFFESETWELIERNVQWRKCLLNGSWFYTESGKHTSQCMFPTLANFQLPSLKPHVIWRKYLLRIMAHSLPPCYFSTGKIGNKRPPEPWRTEYCLLVWYVSKCSQRSKMKYREGSIALNHPAQMGHITFSSSAFVSPLSEEEIRPDNGEDALSFGIPWF